MPSTTGESRRRRDLAKELPSMTETVKRSSSSSSRIADCFCRRPGFVLLLLPIAILASLYVASEEQGFEFESRYPSFYKPYNGADPAEIPDGYLVWNPRCQMLAKEPLDPSIRAYVKTEKFESCSSEPRLTRLTREENGSAMILSVDSTASPWSRARARARATVQATATATATATVQASLECCWSAILRGEPSNEKDTDFDSRIVVKQCETFEGETAVVGEEVEAVFVSCKDGSKGKERQRETDGRRWRGRGRVRGIAKAKSIYENVHAVLRADKVLDRFGRNETGRLSRKLSVLVLGIDSVSRLNFLRSAPTTERYLRDTGWIRMNGYNKMGDNTFPNLMAILTGQNQAQAYSRCKPTVPRHLDRCPFLWRNFRDAGYATAYGEDETALNTFNYLKVGFVEPPTDYYLRPYMLACEKLLKVRKRFGLKYCTGPETSFDRVLDYALDFARAFLGLPYFGFFWTTGISHDNANGLSSMDGRLLGKLKRMEREGVLNDSMIVLLSDHGMRWGPIRNTFVGWYEERLPFLYVRLPEWFRAERPDAYPSLRANRHRLTSPFDLYETFRDVVKLSGGEANPSPACPGCQTLLAPVPRYRGCSDAGISSHWCACTAFKPANPRDPLVERGARVFLEHVDGLLDSYRDDKGRRLCAKLRLKKLHRVDRAIDFANSTALAFFYMIQVAPGDGKFEVTVRYHENGTYTVSDHEVSRINSYATAAKCLDRGLKQYCHCLR